MGVGKRQQAIRAMRGQMWSPGRPSVARREDRQRFWRAIAAGRSTEGAAGAAGVSVPVGVRWFRDGGGMPPISLAPVAGRYLSFAEREEIAILHAQHMGVRGVARQLGRSPSTISRELRRNASTRSHAVVYRATTAQWHAERRASRPKVSKLAANDALRNTCRIVLPARSQVPTAPQQRGLRCPGSAADTVAARIGAGRSRGAPSRSPTGFRSTFLMIPRCGSRTRRSTSRCTSRAAARCAAS
jgi:Helix-turn-helix domain